LGQTSAGLHEGEIVLFDKGYYELAHFRELAERGISFVTRAKDNIACRVKKRLARGKDPRELKDELVVLKGHYSRQVVGARIAILSRDRDLSSIPVRA